MKKNTLFSLVLLLFTSIFYSCNREKGDEIEIVVSVDDNGKANGEHSFIQITDNKFQIDGIVYSVESNGFLEVSGYDKENLKGDAHIISLLEFNGKTYSVNKISGNSLAGCSNITSITIPSSVSSIGSNAFQGCTSLFSINIPTNVCSIGYGILTNSEWYNNQSEGSLYIDKWIIGFKGQKATGYYSIEEGTKGIADYTFYNHTDLTSISMPNSLNYICNLSFME